MIRIAHYKIRVPDRKNRPVRPYSIALLADLHNEVYGSDPEHLVRAVEMAGPLAIFSVGDLVLAKFGRCGYETALGTLRALARISPVYAINGNHETRMRTGERYAEAFRAYDEAVRAAGVIMMNNCRRELHFEGMTVSLSGLEPDYEFYKSFGPRLDAGIIREKLGDPGTGYNILLAHHPKYFPAYARWGADLTLSGHLHGGIVRLPGIGGIIGPGPDLLPVYDRGRFREGAASMIVSAGLGTHTIKLRLFNPAELVILDFE